MAYNKKHPLPISLSIEANSASMPIEVDTETARNTPWILTTPGLFLMLTLVLLLLQLEVFAGNAGNAQEAAKVGEPVAASVDSISTKLIETIFNTWIRKSALVIGGGWGMFQSFMSGSFQPLLLWGGLGAATNYMPVIVKWLIAQ